MPFLRLRDLKSGEAHEFETSTVRVGRDPASELPIAGEAAKVVSSAHLRLVHDGAAWWVEDLGSRNGTYVGARRLTAGSREKLAAGVVIGLGETGPRLKIEAVAGQAMEATMLESPRGDATIAEQPRMARPSAATVRMEGLDDAAPPSAAPPPPPPPPRAPQRPAGAPRAPGPTAPPPPPQTLHIVFREARTGESYEGTGGRLRIGRGQECEVRPVAAGDTAVSRVHAEIVLKPDGGVVVRDARSRNGTLVNGKQLATEHPLKQGDRILLGDGGPELIVERIVAPGAPPQAPAKLAAAGIPPAAEARGRRSFGGKGATVFFKEMMAETDRRARGRIGWVVWSFVGLLVLATGGLYLWSEARVRQTARSLETQQREAMAAAQHAADSLRQAAQAEYEHLRIALDSARGSSAPAAVVESLRTALTQASSRTTALEASLQRAQASLDQQLAAGDSLRRQAQADLQRLRGELNRASGDQLSSALLDSLRRALRGAEERANSIDQQLRAVKGVDLAAISQANQSAVGLVTAFLGNDAWDGSGFVITRSGYFLTNRHVAAPDGRPADSVTITLADQQAARRVEVVAVAPPTGPDLAVLKIPNYAGPYITKADWTGTRARQGEPAALIGFPTGAGLAYDRTRTVRTSMSAGIFSKVTEDRIQFDGFTVGGSSGSPIFNANGEVVAVHAAGLREAAGLGLTVPIRLVIPLLPPDARAELGIS
jgi:pSer/pThr/pTyr-binding forkhead associated (FHA) protein/S1-C subfamily serine protease